MQANEPQAVLYEEEGGRVARLVLDAPPDNALDLRLVESMLTAVTALSRWPNLACVLIEGTGRDFTSGLALAHRRAPYISMLLARYHAAVRALADLDALLVAVVKGRCIGAGSELVLLCDAVFSDPTARFSFPEIRLGAFSPLGTLLLPSRIGPLIARRWLLSARVIEPDEAVAIGLVTENAAGWDSLPTIVDRYIENVVLAAPGVALRASAKALRQPILRQLNDELPALEELFLQRIVPSEDAEEGIEAAQRKRDPKWKHR